MGLERCLPQGFSALLSTFLNKFFDPSTPSMRKVDDRGEKGGGGRKGGGKRKKIMLEIVDTDIVAS